MTLWRVHVELADQPGRLGELATVIGAAGCNILSLHLVGEPADDGAVTDELLVQLPSDTDTSTLLAAIDAVDSRCTLLVPADATELADGATTALALARMVAADPGSAPRAAATLLRAELADPSGADSDQLTYSLRIGTNQLLLRRAWPFTATEISRAAALLELAAQLSLHGPVGPGEPDRILQLSDGSEVRLRTAVPSDAPLVAALHARCSPDSRRSRFLSPTPRLPAAELAELLGAGPDGYALLAITADGGSAVGVASLRNQTHWHQAGPGQAGREPETAAAHFAVLVEDAWQGRGLGTALIRRISETALDRGAQELVGTVRPNELRVTRLLRRAGLHPQAELGPNLVMLRASLPAPVG